MCFELKIQMEAIFMRGKKGIKIKYGKTKRIIATLKKADIRRVPK